MTIDGLAGRLSVAATEVETIRAELERSQPLAVSGPRSLEVLEQIRLAWVGQGELAARVAEQIQRLAADVTQAAQTYREADELRQGHGRGDQSM